MRNLKTLLLDVGFQVVTFVPYRKALKLLIKEKVEVVSFWDEDITWTHGKIKHPAILKLKNHIKKNYFNSNFSRRALVKRDKSICAYCNTKLAASQVTIDHVIPKSQGGVTSFSNCVVSCHFCNNKKANKTPEQASMPLLKSPTHPSFTNDFSVSDPQEFWHPDWSDFLINV